MTELILAFLIGLIAGLRTMTAPAALGASSDALIGGLLAGVLGAIAGTLGGYEFRPRLAKAAGKGLPIALIEDAIAIGGAFLLVSRF